jgi:hypothetical protein
MIENKTRLKTLLDELNKVLFKNENITGELKIIIHELKSKIKECERKIGELKL